MFQLILKTGILLFISFNSIGAFQRCISDELTEELLPICKTEELLPICKDVFFKIVHCCDGKARNLLQKTNKELNKILSKKNCDFLLFVNPFSLLRADMEDIWIKAYLSNTEVITNYFEKYIKEINIFTVPGIICDNKIKKIYDKLGLPSKISIQSIKEFSLIANASRVINKEGGKTLKGLLQIVALYGNLEKITMLSTCIKKAEKKRDLNYYIADKNLLAGKFKLQCQLTCRILEEAMQQGNIEVFKIIATIDPFRVGNLAYILELLNNIKIDESQKNIKEQCIELYKELVLGRPALQNFDYEDDRCRCRCKCVLF